MQPDHHHTLLKKSLTLSSIGVSYLDLLLLSAPNFLSSLHEYLYNHPAWTEEEGKTQYALILLYKTSFWPQQYLSSIKGKFLLRMRSLTWLRPIIPAKQSEWPA